MKKLFLSCVLLLLTISCSGQSHPINPGTKPWTYSDLIAVDPSDTVSPYTDTVALFSRQDKELVQFRIDFLDQKIGAYPDILLILNNGWIGNQSLPFDILPHITWNYLLWVASDGHAELTDQNDKQVEAAKISVIHDLNTGSILISFDASAIFGFSSQTQVELFSIDPSSSEVDQVNPVRLSALPPAAGKVILAFWDTFQGDTPAQALRSWNGAHTGPLSSRHGLISLVESIEQTGVPVFLFDFGRSKTWAALDFLGVARRIRTLVQQNKIILADTPHAMSPELVQINSEAENSFNDLSKEIPSIETRRALIDTTQDPNHTLLLGGDFGQTAWGNYTFAFQMLSYIKNHPWVEPVSNYSLIDTQADVKANNPDPLVGDIRRELWLAPKNSIRKLSEQLLSSLTEPGSQMERDLRHAYIGQIGHLLAISKWSANRKPIADCSQDLDWDHEVECVLASNQLAVVIDPLGGYISYAFSYQAGEYHQFIGPSYQLAIGLSDPVEWRLDQGIAADPSIIPGAFSSMDKKFEDFQATQVQPDEIILRDDEDNIEKRFRVTDEGIVFQYAGIQGDMIAVPLILDPWVMDQAGWANLYINQLDSQHWTWGIANRIFAEAIFKDPFDISTFKDSISLVQLPEDPSYAYPAGHYLPFPLALGQFVAHEQGSVEIKLSYKR